MKKNPVGKDAWIIIISFVVSRIIVGYFGIHFGYKALFQYWQYLDVETLRYNLLRGVWYDHAQPPFFNLLLGAVVKLSGDGAPFVFATIFKLITLVNSLLLFIILKRLTKHQYIPLIISLLYLLSPASLIFECELFYTEFVSMLLLTSSLFLFRLKESHSWKNCLGVFIPLIILCLTRSLYHVFWLACIAMIVLLYNRKKPGFNKLLLCSLFSIIIVGSWYFKNYIIFGKFSTSTWIGMNTARNVFHDNEITDSSRIEAFEPFSKISTYSSFLSPGYEKKYIGLNDLDLLHEMKNDSFINANHVGYIEVSDKYMEASKRFIKSNPVSYLKNVMQSSIIFFAPATRYPTTEKETKKIKYYDVLYSFNLSHFAEGKQQRRIGLTVSAIPKILIYLYVFWGIFIVAKRQRKIDLPELFIIITIAFVFIVSSMLEHYENMRFRYEIEPLFLILLGERITTMLKAKQRQEFSLE